MRIKVQAKSIHDVPYLHRDGIAIPVNGWKEMEVLDGEDNPPGIVSAVPNTTTGGKMNITRPNQDVIGRRTYKRLCDDGRFTVVSTETVDMELSREHVAAARAQVQELSGELADAKVTMAGLNASLADRASQLEAAQLRIMELEDEVKAALAQAGTSKELEAARARVAELETQVATKTGDAAQS